MNEDEKEVLKVGAEAAMKPFADLIRKLFGGPVEEIGGAWQDSLATRRKIRQIKLFKKLQVEIDKAGFEPRQIPDNIWVPALTEALQQDDEILGCKWAKLLATAAHPNAAMIPASFPRILADISGREARFLDRLYDRLAEQSAKYEPRTKMAFTKPLSREEFLDIYMLEEFEVESFNMEIDNLLRLRVLEAEPKPLDRDEFLAGRSPNDDDPVYRLSALGLAFISSCKGTE